MAKDKTLLKPRLKSRSSQAFWGVVGLVLAYVLISRALDTGSYWQYLGGFICAGLGIKLLVLSLKK